MFGNLGSRNLFEVRELNYFSGSRSPSPSSRSSTARSSPAAAHKKAMSSGSITITSTPEYSISKPLKSMTSKDMEKAVETAQKKSLYDEVMAKNKATEEFIAKWHGVRENGVLVKEPTATRTDAIQALLTSNNQHFGADTRNLEQYLTERDYDISAIIAGEQTVPDDIFKPNKQLELRKKIREETENLALTQAAINSDLTEKNKELSNYQVARNRSGKIIGSTSKDPEEVNIIINDIETLEAQKIESSNKINETINQLNAELARTQDENTIRETVAPALTETPVIQESRFNFLPLIIIAVVGLIAIYLIRRLKK